MALTLTATALTAQLLSGTEELLLRPAPDGRAYLLEPARSAPNGPCGVVGGGEPALLPGQPRPANASSLPAPGSFGTQLRTVRMAMLVTAEFYADNKGTGNSDQNVEAAVATVLNSIAAFYQQELSVSFTLVKPTSGAFYFSAMTTPTLPSSDPTTAGRVRDQNPGDARDLINARFAAGSFDLGHCLHNSGGGVAYVPAICSSNRGGGFSGASTNGFQHLFAHEVGHQFGAGHTFNGPCGGQSVGSNLEPGSGSTIMSYSYVCGSQNLLDQIPYNVGLFNLRSLDQMRTQLLSADCASPVLTQPSTNRVPVVAAGADYIIPTQTPFTLAATASDPDGDAVTYTWDQFDYTANVNALGTRPGVNGLAAIDDPEAPLFRPRLPTPANSRTFPDLRYILANSNQPDDLVGEALSRVGRDIHFGVTARDNAAGGGAWASDNVTVTVAPNTGPFAVTTQNAASLWIGGQPATITWSVNGTNLAPINVSQVRITLSTDGGQTFPTVLAASTPNDGSYTMTIPANVTTTQARLRVEAVGNIFFDINDVNFPIGPCAPAATQLLPATALTAPAGDAALNMTENAYSLTQYTNSGAGQIQGSITAADPITYLTTPNGSGCTRYSNTEYYDSYVFVPSTTGAYTIDTPTGFYYLIIRVYDSNGFVPDDPCRNVVANNYVNGSAPRSLTVNLTAGQPYTLVLANFGDTPPSAPSPGAYKVTFTSAPVGGAVYVPLTSAGYEYQYAVVNTATNTVVQLAPNADLRTLPAGTYDVYGLLFQRGYDVSGQRNQSLGSLQAALSSIAPCGQLSNNVRRVTITGTSLPVVLTSFTGWAAGVANELRWQTASEQGVAHFEVQRSLTGEGFTSIGRVAATNSSRAHSYFLTDAAPPDPLAYYRLLVQDVDGSAAYSPVVTVARNPAGQLVFSAVAYPNPLPNGTPLQLRLHSSQAQTVELSVTDALGRALLRQDLSLPAGITLRLVPEASQWHGLYLLHVRPASGPSYQQKLILE